jgi:hypothetical protein
MTILIFLLAYLARCAVTYFGTPSRLMRDTIVNQSLATGASVTYDVECSATDWLTVQGDLTGAAAADLSVNVFPYENDGVTLTPIPLAPAVTVANTLSGGHIYAYDKFDVTGIGRVRIAWKNNNAGTQTLTRGSWRAQNW